MRKTTIYVVVILMIAFSGCFNFRTSGYYKSKSQNSTSLNLLDTILTRKKIIALTDFGPTNFFIYRGKTMGYQYELLQNFAKYLGVSVDLRVQPNLDSAVRLLREGKVDILAMGLTVTSKREKEMSFSDPLFYTRQMLVQRKPNDYQDMTQDQINAHLIRHVYNLGGKTIHVQKGTIHEAQLLLLQNQIADSIHIIEDTLATVQLIAEVAKGKIKYTVADEVVAKIAARIYPNIDVNTPLSIDQKISWGIRRDQKPLLDTLNSWLSKFMNTLEARLLYNKYFKNAGYKSITNHRYLSYQGGKLSPYDAIIKEAAKKIGWDWRLLASVIYQESGFKKDLRSWVGAYGLMQMMPKAMEIYNIDSLSTPKAQIMAGAAYLKTLEQELPDSITDTIDRIKFALACYNGGIGHVMDARRLAKKYGKNPNIWDGNVDYYVLHLSEKIYYDDPVVKNGYMRGWETYRFVKDIFARYRNYKKLLSTKRLVLTKIKAH